MVAHHLPPQLQGKGIVDGPLPFLFGTEAAKLKARYWLRIVPPVEKSPPDQIMLEARPKYREDAQNYVRAQVILQKQDLTMHGLRAAARHIRREVGDHVAIKQMPELVFRLDQSLKKQAGVLDAIAKATAEREARDWVRRVDGPNAEAVRRTRGRADLVLDVTGWTPRP